MILSKTVETTVVPRNAKEWAALGYRVPKKIPREGVQLKVKVEHLKPASNIEVECRCDRCGQEYTQRFSRDTDVCYPCRKSERMKGNKLGTKNKGRKMPHMSGENHPRWNPNKYVSPNKGVGKGKMNKGKRSPNKGKFLPDHLKGKNHPRWNPLKSEYRIYCYKVHQITAKNYQENITIINPNNYPRTLNGVDGGWQLDHKISIREGFLTGKSPEEIANTNNLQMLPWKENRDKW